MADNGKINMKNDITTQWTLIPPPCICFKGTNAGGVGDIGGALRTDGDNPMSVLVDGGMDGGQDRHATGQANGSSQVVGMWR